MHEHAEQFRQLFEGYAETHGVYRITPGTQPEGGKIKGQALTVNEPVTMQKWSDHLSGNHPLGIIPINRESKAKFGAIDIDEYPLHHVKLMNEIDRLNLPLVTCRTKSGGAHLFVFTTEWVPAKLIQDKLREMASALGHGTAEVFPKQTQLLSDRGDIGSWINLPYFDGDRGNRYAFNYDNSPKPLRDFLEWAYERRITPDKLAAIRAEVPETLEGGPPCLQRLIKQGFPNGTRNSGLFNLGVYARKAHAEDWEKYLEEYNHRFMQPPLDATEVLGVMKSLRRKDYQYTCKQAPIHAYCHASLCRTCKFGIGDGDLGMPKFGSLTKLCTTPPVWFLEIEGGGRLELTTEDLQSPFRFQRKCMESLNLMPGMMKDRQWQEIISKLLEDCHVVEVPPEATERGLLIQHLEDFCVSRVQAKAAEEILLGKPWMENGRHHFRLMDFEKYLQRVNFKGLNRNFIVVYIRDQGGERLFMRIKGKGVNVWTVPEFKNKQTEAHETPREGKAPF